MNAARASLLALLLCWAFAALADVAVPPLTGRVVDQTGTLSSDIAALTQTLKDFETRKGSQIAVLIVPTTAPETIEQYSIRVAEAWKIGRKKIDDGAILLIAKDDHKLRIEVGYGLEGALTDVTAQRIIDEVITPKFKSGDFSGGISAGIDRIIRVVDGEPLPVPAPQASHGSNSDDWISFLNPLNPFTIFGVLVLGGDAAQPAGSADGFDSRRWPCRRPYLVSCGIDYPRGWRGHDPVGHRLFHRRYPCRESKCVASVRPRRRLVRRLFLRRRQLEQRLQFER